LLFHFKLSIFRSTKFVSNNLQIKRFVYHLDIESSNLKETFEWAINISLKLPLLWDSGGIGVKENLQKMVVPKGIRYYHKKGTFLTDEVNDVFEPIPRLNCISESDKNKQGSISAALSNFIGAAIVELVYKQFNSNSEA
jgi:hypothetical protein